MIKLYIAKVNLALQYFLLCRELDSPFTLLSTDHHDRLG